MAEADACSRGRKHWGLLDQPYLLLSLTSLFWAINTIVGRLSAGHIPPLTLACLRWGGAFVILLPFAALPLARVWPTIRKHIGTLALLAFSGFSAYNAITYYALQYTTAINGLLMQSSAPLFVALWSFLLLGERLTLHQAGGICVSLTGILTIISQGSLAVLLGVGFNYGDPWFLIALLIYGYYMAAFRNRPPLHPVSFLAVGIGLGTLFLLPGMLWEIAQGKSFALDARNVASLAFLWVFHRLSVSQSRRRIDRRQPRGAVRSSGAGVRLGDRSRFSRRALRVLSRHRLCAGVSRHHGGGAEVM